MTVAVRRRQKKYFLPDNQTRRRKTWLSKHEPGQKPPAAVIKQQPVFGQNNAKWQSTIIEHCVLFVIAFCHSVL